MGATKPYMRPYAIELVSIHAPVWVRLLAINKSDVNLEFQFTHPCGCDSDCGSYMDFCKVSIHAPVWVRPDGSRVKVYLKGFQFTHPCGCDA